MLSGGKLKKKKTQTITHHFFGADSLFRCIHLTQKILLLTRQTEEYNSEEAFSTFMNSPNSFTSHQSGPLSIS